MNTKSKTQVMPKRLETLLAEFVSATKHWGWFEDQGSGPSVDHAKKEYEESLDKMRKTLTSLDKDAAILRRMRRESRRPISIISCEDLE